MFCRKGRLIHLKFRGVENIPYIYKYPTSANCYILIRNDYFASYASLRVAAQCLISIQLPLRSRMLSLFDL